MNEGKQETLQMDPETVSENRDLPSKEPPENEMKESSEEASVGSWDVSSSCPLEEEENDSSRSGTNKLLGKHEITISDSRKDPELLESNQNDVQIEEKNESENCNELNTENSALKEQVEIEAKSVNNNISNNGEDEDKDGDNNDNANESLSSDKSITFVDNSSNESSNIMNSTDDVTSSEKANIQDEENFKEIVSKTSESEGNNEFDICTSKVFTTVECNEKQSEVEDKNFNSGAHFKEGVSNQIGEILEIEKKQVENESNKSEDDQIKNEENEQIELKSEETSLSAVVHSPACFDEDNSSECKASDSTLQDGKAVPDIRNSPIENVFSEVCKESKELQFKNDCVQECVNSSNNNNVSNTGTECTESADGDNLTKIDNYGTEIMDTEMVNCNEIELINLNENDLQRDKEVDRIGSEQSEIDQKQEENKSEEMVCDVLESCYDKCSFEVKVSESENVGENLKEILSYNDTIHPAIQPGNSEEETITGDTSTLSAPNLENSKDEDVCIIPDDISPRLSIMSQNKSAKLDSKKKELENSEKPDVKIIPLTNTEAEKSKHRSDGKKLEGIENLKSRPVRNAAKLAGNKIRSLVLNDLVYDEQASSSVVKGEGDALTNSEESHRMCAQCREVKLWKFLMVHGNTNQYLCSEQCSEAFAKNCQTDRDSSETESATGEFIRKCAQCHTQVTINEKCLFWETMDFCNEDCLGKYQTKLGSNCANCKGLVFHSSLGKYCVRFGYDVKQFCSASCLEEYKKGLKVCSYCQKDISTGMEGFLAPVGDKGQFKDFCTQSCMEKYEQMSSNVTLPDVIEECAVCSNSKPVRVEVELDNKTHKLCSEPCFAAFKFVNNITEGQCDMCRKYFDRSKTENFAVFYDETPRSFCCKTCMNVYILANRKIVPCNWCKVKKYNFDMIKKGTGTGQASMMCSLNCLALYQLSLNAVSSRRMKCDFCMSLVQSQYHLTMSDATVRNFCSYTCVVSFQNQYPKQGVDLISGTDQLNSPIPTGVPRRVTPRRSQVESPCVPIISSVQSLASNNGPASPVRFTIPRSDANVVSPVNPISQSMTLPTTVASMPAPPPQIYQQIITKPAPAKQMKNKSVLCKPYSHTKGVSCRPHPCVKETQTDQSLNRKYLIPIPVPIYVPAPMHMFATPFPVPVPFPLPIPVPVFIPTTRNSAKGILKEIKKIQEKIPTDPFEAELLMMAEMVAGDKKQDPTDSESDEGNDGEDGRDGTFSPENVDASNTFGDDMLQMALKMASELEEPAVDMESVLTSNTITTSTQPSVDPNKALYASDPDNPDQVHVMSMNRGRKRSVRGQGRTPGGTPSKRGRRTSGSVDVPLLPPPEPVPPPRIEVEKPDANMCLKYTFGVNAWRHWVMQKNAELEKAALTNRKIKLFKPELLQLTADELNFSLCLFVKEVRKPNGTEYAPDTIYYLCLGIQQYLFENGRIDNIFTDSYYEKFTDCLDEVAKKFAALYNDSQYIVTRVEEEHLWESKQLGAHSPHVLLSTLMFFNTKHFNLVTVEEHMQLSFSHIMKHWKRNPNTPGVAKVPGSRNVLLRFYPPQSALEANSRKKKVYEQQENEENPLRCPVKLYEFYLSKCPESVKTRNDVFYLLPERSCVPDSPVWYSTMALGKEPLMKMLHRVKMVKEINIALLTC